LLEDQNNGPEPKPAEANAVREKFRPRVRGKKNRAIRNSQRRLYFVPRGVKLYFGEAIVR